MKQILQIVLILATLNVFSQQEYSLVKAEGKIPDAIINMNKETYNTAKKNIKGSRSEKKDKNEFLLKSNYQLGNLLKSGRILFGDEFTNYVTKIGNKLLENHPELKDKVQFYVVKSPEVNAYSTQQGYLFVNLGLIAQVENEAQLAFVISHELIHYTEKHSIESFLEGKKIERKRGDYKSLNTYSKQKGYFLKYSKENEMEADKKGFEDYYLKAGYDVNEALSVFDVLLYSYLPVDELDFDTAFFNDEYFKLSKKYFLKETKAITAIEDYDDSEHTHPNIKRRREVFIDYIADNDVEEGVKYMFTEQSFKAIQKNARYELSNLHTKNTHYCSAIYNSYLLLKNNPKDIYLERNIAYNLYALSKYRTHKSIRDVIPRAKKIEGESQQVFNIFNKIGKKDLNILALKYNWKLYNQTKDSQFKRQYKDLLWDLAYENGMYYNKFKKVKKDTLTKFKEISKEEYNKLTKYAKIKYDKKKKSLNDNGVEGIEIALVDLLQNSDFSKEFKEQSRKAKDKKEEEEQNELIKKKKKKKKNIKFIDEPIDKLLIPNPFFVKYDSNGDKMHIKSEERELEYITFLKQIAKTADVDVTILDIFTITKDDINKFNQIALLNSWLNEFAYHQNYNELWEIYNSQDLFLKQVLKDNGKQYFSVSGTYSQDYKPKLVAQYFYVIDSETGKVVLINYLKTYNKEYNALIKSFLYDSFINLKRNNKN